MQSSAESYLLQLNKNNSTRSHLRQSLLLLSLVVVLSVFWNLKLTGITMAGEAFCGMEEHVHAEDCPVRTLICEQEESEYHMHTESCLVKQLTCELEEITPHTHSDECVAKNLVCTQEETEGHTHDSSCIQKELICQLAEEAPHSHSEECYSKTLLCDQLEVEAHFHDEACYSSTLICSQPEVEAHFHSDGCYTSEIGCGQEESELHSHDDSCMITYLSCSMEETEGHYHDSSCMEISLTCTREETEGHSHDDGCYQSDLTCTQAETEGHSHGDGCYRELPGFICGQEEHPPHTHEDNCYEAEEGCFVCGLEETEGHLHDDGCYHYGIGFGCGLTEAEGHIHTVECIMPETEFSCGKEISEGHAHDDSCYDILESCPLEEHIHDETCYSDINADIETSDDWELSLAYLSRSPSTAKNVVSVAQSQLGCAESTRNFVVDEAGIRRGITRYGQWYGNPYGDWSSMFVSFCLSYAGVDAPFNGGAEAMRLEWEEAGLYIPAAEYAPLVGHVLFLDRDLNGQADATAIIETYDATTIFLIEGDVTTYTEESSQDIVAQTSIPMDDPAILGYGLIQDDAMLMVLPSGDTQILGTTAAYSSSLLSENASFILYVNSGVNTYAFDGSGNAVPIYIDENGTISTDLENPESLLWTFTNSGNTNTYLIQNLSTGRYMHAYSGGVTTSGAYASTLIPYGSGVKVRSNTEYARLDPGSGTFVMTQNQNLAAAYQFGIRNMCTVWLDGTCGGLMSLAGSPDEAHHITAGDTILLPEEWESPDKYSYRLRGWYDVVNGVYYAPGDEVVVTENMVFYADWAASTYDIGVYNSQSTETISTRDFVTTHVFDYGILFNVLSENPDVTISATSHSETWHLLTSGANAYNGSETLNFIMRDWDRGSEDISYPVNNNAINDPTNGGVYSGLYSSQIRNLLFGTGNSFNPETGEGVIGKQYLGTGDHLFQHASDPSHPYYGYYYYDSSLNAASYNQSAGRFYVYDYLECTSDSANNSKYSDFLPLNSPYVNTNGNNLPTYHYSGELGEYNGTTHYMYDAKYEGSGSSPGNVGTNFWFGMSIDISFYLPNTPGTRDEQGEYGNKDVYGNDMHFHFSGDDDVWVLVDGQLVLDLGGIHGIESGDINFTTGDVTVNGTVTGNVRNLAAGDHTLTILYLERGSSQSNCAIYFNLAPRFSFSIQKEDILTQDVLNGAQFSVYTDRECTIPAELWASKAAHDSGAAATNTFTITNGVANMWGMGAGNTYYIKETRPPDDEAYTYSHGIICVSIDKQGQASYSVEMAEETNPDGTTTDISAGFTVHGFRIDEETQQAYIIATNAPSWAKDTTKVYVEKKWSDSANHNGQSVTVYLTITDPDGTVRQLREVQLSSGNGWSHTWENLPKFYEDGSLIQYGVQEVSVPGYMGTVEAIRFSDVTQPGTGSGTGSGSASAAGSFENGSAYLLKTNYGYLAASNNQLQLVSSESEAMNDAGAQWVSTVNGDGSIVLTNKAGQTLYYDNYTFKAASAPGTYKNLRFSGNLLYCYIDHGGWSETLYPNDGGNAGNNLQYNHVLYTTPNQSDALSIIPMKLGASEPETPDAPELEEEDLAYRITNSPLEEETSLQVSKVWDYGSAKNDGQHETYQVTVRLLANGINTGRTVTLNLKNSWRGAFQGLPYTDANGNVIVYTVEEIWKTEDWIPYYGEITINSGDPPTYSTQITNVYRWGTGAELPSTGSAARMLYALCGGSMMLASLAYGIVLRRRRERRQR